MVLLPSLMRIKPVKLLRRLDWYFWPPPIFWYPIFRSYFKPISHSKSVFFMIFLMGVKNMGGDQKYQSKRSTNRSALEYFRTGNKEKVLVFIR